MAGTTSIQRSKALVISYAQNFEDVMLARVFAGRTDGFYVDVGAGDPSYLSVTKWFYDLGWSGINIEPNRALFSKLAAARPRDINLDCAAGAASGTAEFFETEAGEFSTLSPQSRDANKAEGLAQLSRAVTVAPLSTILQQHAVGRRIDFLKIDVEGWEHEVLCGLDLEKYRPTVILLEATLPRQRIESSSEWEYLLH